MCGIAGIINLRLESKEKIIGQMTEVITHRGPDEDGFYVDELVGLGMRRLSIIDLSTGEQPIYSKNEDSLIFFNGEIYNYLELREELIKKKYEFKTNTDTEVILHMYEEYGEKMLTSLRGMFTFCIYDIKKKELFIARDYFGIKPLYYYVQEDKICAFSSEIKSFFQIPEFKAEVNDNAVYNYLSYQYNPLPETFFKNVYKLPPAHFLKIDIQSSQSEVKKYWSFQFLPEEKMDESMVVKQIFYSVKDSVEHHMIADVPVGAFLSGGIDSSIITTLMQKIRGTRKIKTFTVGFDTLTEGKEAKETSNFLETDHTEIMIGPDEYFSVLSKVVYHFDEPVADPSAVGIYFLAREARKSVKVVLSGEGSDELFGGYNIYLEPMARHRFSWFPKSVLNGLVYFFDKYSLKFWGTNYLRRVSSELKSWYIGNASIFIKDELDIMWKGRGEEPFPLNFLYNRVGNLDEPTQMQYIDINTWLVGDILAKADKMTMANSLELRVPFLDIEVANLARKLPSNLKWRNGVTKYILREAFKNLIPENTRNRRKLGFPTPIRDWLTKERNEIYKIILSNKYINDKLDVKYVEKIINDHLSGKLDNSRKIYTLLMLALWYDVYISKKVRV